MLSYNDNEIETIAFVSFLVKIAILTKTNAKTTFCFKFDMSANMRYCPALSRSMCPKHYRGPMRSSRSLQSFRLFWIYRSTVIYPTFVTWNGCSGCTWALPILPCLVISLKPCPRRLIAPLLFSLLFLMQGLSPQHQRKPIILTPFPRATMGYYGLLWATRVLRSSHYFWTSSKVPNILLLSAYQDLLQVISNQWHCFGTSKAILSSKAQRFFCTASSSLLNSCAPVRSSG